MATIKVDDARISAIWLAAWLFYLKNQSQIAAVNNVTSNNICIAGQTKIDNFSKLTFGFFKTKILKIFFKSAFLFIK
jgi:hypothetical protein